MGHEVFVYDSIPSTGAHSGPAVFPSRMGALYVAAALAKGSSSGVRSIATEKKNKKRTRYRSEIHWLPLSLTLFPFTCSHINFLTITGLFLTVAKPSGRVNDSLPMTYSSLDRSRNALNAGSGGEPRMPAAREFQALSRQGP